MGHLLSFPVIKLRDYRQCWSELEQSDNPFAIVVMAHLQTQATQGNPEARLNEKLRIVRRLYEQGYSRQDILKLFRFIDWVLVLPAGLEARFQIEPAQLEAERNMPYVTSVERMGIEKEIQQGLQQGKATLVTGLQPTVFGQGIAEADGIEPSHVIGRQASFVFLLFPFRRTLANHRPIQFPGHRVLH
ncbi:MAG: hypothetical protein U1F76_12495 [Candidatus Competibacteraceae bacterium]